MKYLLIFEDFSMCTIDREPTAADLESIQYGALSIIKFEDGEFLDMTPKGDFEPIPEE